jgi:mxaK protein
MADSIAVLSKVTGKLPRLSFFLYSFAWLALGISLFAAVVSALDGYTMSKENRLIEQLLNGEDITANELVSAMPETRLARAAALLQKQQQQQDALESLSMILNRGDIRLQAKTRYNLGNIYLRQAISQVEAGHPDEAKTLVTLAKQAYREALLRDSAFWDAKYNLEVAMRLLPDFDRINVDENQGEQPKNPLWTTVPGFPRGLP